MWILRRISEEQVKSRLALALALLSIASATPCEAGVFAIGDDGAMSGVTGIDAAPPASLAPLPSASDPVSEPATLTSLVQKSAPARFAAATVDAAAANGLAPDLLSAVIWQESHWHSSAISRAGAIGLAQLMPMTAGEMRVDPRDPVASLYGAAHYLRQQLDRFHGNVELALAAYNAGPVRVVEAGGVPAIRETRDYVASVMNRLSATVNKDN